ncbi:MAG: hypothetical protein HFE28_05180 [Clostridia bacterium]|jgi:hypothetical protein|nr:hypothetical protein [Clostridia bacterium]
MADREKKGLIARWLEGKERDEEYARSTLPTSRWALFWDILKGRFGKLFLVNLLMLLTILPMFAIVVMRTLFIYSQGMSGPFGSGLGVGYPIVPDVTGVAQASILRVDLLWFALLIPASLVAAVGLSGGMYIIRNLIWTEGVFVANDFVRGIKRNYFNVLEALLIFTVVLFLARVTGDLADYLVAIGAPGSGWLVASKVVGYILVAFMIPVCMWMLSLGVNYKQGPWSLFRNAVIMTIGTFPQTILFAAVALWPFFLLLFTGTNIMFLFIIAIFVMIILGCSYTFLVWFDYSQWAFDKFVNPNMGYAVGRGLYNKDKPKSDTAGSAASPVDSEAMREYRRMIVAQGRSKLVCRPIKPIDDGEEMYQLPDSFSRDDLRRLRESKQTIEDNVKAYEEEHKNDERYVEYNKQFDERERAIQEEEAGEKKKKKKQVKPPKMLNKNK